VAQNRLVVASQSPLHAAQSRLRSHSKVRSARYKVDFGRILKSAPRDTKSTSVFKSHSKVRSVRHKVNFGFQVAYQSPLRAATKVDFGFQVAYQSLLRAAQSRLRFSSRILKSALTTWLLLKLQGSIPNYYLESLQLRGYTHVTTLG
jgi:hypothetical protein